MTHNHNGVNKNQPSKGNELQRVKEYLQKQPATATETAVAMGIYRPSLCRRKRTLEKSGNLKQIKRIRCSITNCIAWQLTTNPALFPPQSQLNLF